MAHCRGVNFTPKVLVCEDILAIGNKNTNSVACWQTFKIQYCQLCMTQRPSLAQWVGIAVGCKAFYSYSLFELNLSCIYWKYSYLLIDVWSLWNEQVVSIQFPVDRPPHHKISLPNLYTLIGTVSRRGQDWLSIENELSVGPEVFRSSLKLKVWK